MADSFTDRLQARLAQHLLEQAKREVGASRPRMTPRLIFGWAFAVSILATPYLLILFGVLLIVVKKLSIMSVIGGLILVCFGYALLPPRHRNSQKTYRPNELPALFGLLDSISAQLGVPPPDGVHFTDDFNAYMTQFRKPWSRQNEWVIGIGMTLWTAASDAERYALLAHEIAHKANNDPLRSGVFFDAKTVLENWHDTFYVDENGYDSIGTYHGYSAPVIRMIIAGWISLLSHILMSVTFRESQLAEYRADGFAAKTCGRENAIELLRTLTRADLARRAIVDLYPYRADQNGRIFDHLGATVAGADPTERKRFMERAANERRRVDSSHPPTSMRIEFLESLPEASDKTVTDPAATDFDAIDAELEPIKEALGREMMQTLYEIEVNR